MFFWLYAIIELLAIFLDSGIIPTANSSYPVEYPPTASSLCLIFWQWFAAVYTGLVAATHCCLLISGFVGFQFAEDGTPPSLWVCHLEPSIPFRNDLPQSSQRSFFAMLVCLAVFSISFFIGIATFKSFAGFSFSKPIGLWIVYILWPLVCTVIYVVLQLILVFRTLDDRWPIGDIIFGTAFFTIGQVLLFGFSVNICNAIKHYIDGLFFFTLCILLSVMMVYKYWDSITVCSPAFAFLFFSFSFSFSDLFVHLQREDLEFSAGSRAAV